MGQVKLLPAELQKAIRAGEVIDRPASVLRELLDNALDACATEIEVQILGSGSGLIKVIDNGNGILREDLPLCVQRHTTSKIYTLDDLFRIQTLGFRGEALYSIASVSKLRITSQAKEEPLGGFIEVHGGRLISQGPASTIGTTVEVRDLFYNTPARKKFLKSPRTELYHLITAFQEAALCYPGVAFKLMVQNRQSMHLPKALSLRDRLIQVYGQETIEPFIEASIKGVHVFINPKAQLHRPIQFVAVNSRAVQDRTIRAAVTQALKDTKVEDPRRISYFIFLSVNPEEVDFNVHPQKREVRFRDEKRLFQSIYHILRESIIQQDKTITMPGAPVRYNQIESKAIQPLMSDPPYQQSSPSVIVQEQVANYSRASYRFLTILPGYFCFTDGQSLYLVDQHAAHERILYEKLRGTLQGSTQRLLFPRQVRLPAREFEAVQEVLPILKDMGIEAEVFGDRTLMVRTLPEALRESPLQELLIELARTVMETPAGTSTIEEIKDRMAKTIACHRSVRAGQYLTELEMQTLVDELQKTTDPTRCPHGRPTIVKFSKDDLERLFGRKT